MIHQVIGAGIGLSKEQVRGFEQLPANERRITAGESLKRKLDFLKIFCSQNVVLWSKLYKMLPFDFDLFRLWRPK